MRSLTLILFCFTSYTVFSQWTSDSANPLVICEAEGHQEEVQSLEDDEGGWYVFWRDQRNDPTANGNYGIYAQRVSNGGIIQWAPNGLPMTNHPGQNIREFAVDKLANGKLMMVYLLNNNNSADSIIVQLVDADGNLEWTEGTVIAELGEAQIGFKEIDILAIGNSALISYYRTVVGGQNRTYVDKVEQDGSTLFGLSGSQIETSNFGPFGLLSDDNGGAIVHWRNSNGAGTHLSALRINDQCVPQWANIVDPVSGSPGLNWDYVVSKDGEGGIAFAFISQSKAMYTRLNAAGAIATSPQLQPLGDFDSQQDKPWMLQVDDFYYVLWEDNRPPANNQDLYIQKINLNGDPEWAEEGVLAVSGQTYIPHAKMVATDSAGVIVAQLQSSAGLAAQRIRQDGSAAWENIGFFVDASKEPFYQDFTMHPDGEGGAVAFWRSFDTDEIYANHISFYGITGPNTLAELPENSFSIWPNPTSDILNIRLEKFDGQFQVTILDVTGKVQQRAQMSYGDAPVSMDVSGLSRGVYIVDLVLNHQKGNRRLLKF